METGTLMMAAEALGQLSLAPMLRTDLESGMLLRTAMDVFPHLSGMEMQALIGMDPEGKSVSIRTNPVF